MSNEKRDQMESLVDLKTVEAAIVTKFDELKSVYERANGEIRELGAAKEETVGQLKSLSKQYDELYERVRAVEQKGAFVATPAAAATVGQQFVKSEAFEALREGRASRGRMEIKTAIVNATGASQPLVQADRDTSGIYVAPSRVLRIRDVLPVRTTSSNLVEFTRENVFTNNAGPTISGSPEQVENVTKPESAITFTLASEPVRTLAHFIPASKQVLEDSPMLAAHIDSRLMYGLKLKEETQLLTGTGINGQLNGLNVVATAFTPSSPQQTNEIDIIRRAIRQCHVADYNPDFLVLNPIDWYDIEIRKVGASDDRYVVGDPSKMGAPNLWGLPVIITNSMTSGKFLVGSSRACEIVDRQQAVVELSLEDSTNFQKNMVTVRAEERLALVTFRTESFIYGSL